LTNSDQPASLDYSKYVGIPYKFGGCDLSGADCWGLVCMVLSDLYGKELPRYQTSETSREDLAALIQQQKHTVRQVKVAQPGDIIVLTIVGQPCHTGIVVSLGRMLHTLAGHDSALEFYTASRWSKRIEGVYRVY